MESGSSISLSYTLKREKKMSAVLTELQNYKTCHKEGFFKTFHLTEGNDCMLALQLKALQAVSETDKHGA